MPDKPELWVRIFPDDVFVQTHEPGVTADELTSTAGYWGAIWAADRTFAEAEAAADFDRDAAVAVRAEAKMAAWRGLVASYGIPRAAWLVRATEPTNRLNTDRVDIDEVEFDTAPQLPNVEQKAGAWTAPPYTVVLPDRFVVRLRRGETVREVVGKPTPDRLPIGPDPEEAEVDAFTRDGHRLRLPDELRWLGDFEAAERVGMAIRVPLSPIETEGFDEVVVLGIKVSADKDEAQTLLEALIENHHYKEGGFGLVPQGTPTNNTSTSDAAEQPRADATEAARDTELGPAAFQRVTDALEKTDGQRLAEALGIRPEVLQNVTNAERGDVAEAMHMNRALWPATLGYYLTQFWRRSVGSSDASKVREFFVKHVAGRGMLPVVRVDNQPYGVLATTAYSRWGTALHEFEGRLFHNVMTHLDREWERVASTVKSLGDPSLSEQFSEVFLEILGLQPSAVEFYKRHAVGPYTAWALQNAVPVLANKLGRRLTAHPLARLGFDLPEFPWLFRFVTLQNVLQLTGPVIDPLALSEVRRVRPLPGASRNYLEWLATSAQRAVQEEDFSTVGADADMKPPRALLYLMARHALLRSYLDTAADILVVGNAGTPLVNIDFELETIDPGPLINPEHERFLRDIVRRDLLTQMEIDLADRVRRELPGAGPGERRAFMNRELGRGAPPIDMAVRREIDRQTAAFTLERNRQAYLDNAFPSVSGSKKMVDFIDDLAAEGGAQSEAVAAVRASLQKLQGLPTARLERAFAEHVDLASHRVDAWLQGFVHDRLEKLRADGGASGIYLGAYGVVRDLRPSDQFGIAIREIARPRTVITSDRAAGISPVVDRTLTPAVSRRVRSRAFVYLGGDRTTSLMLDTETNEIVPRPRIDEDGQGFVLAPSMAHAVTAAILRSGHRAHRATGSPLEPLAVNLTSERVRRALSYLEGMRQGQELAALLGYQFERGLHDGVSGAVMDQHILDIRLKFPLRAGKVAELEGADSVEVAEARNVVDGLALLEAFRRGDWVTSIAALESNAADRGRIEEELRRLDRALDAISDLLVAESVYQMVLGNPERSAATLRALNQGGEILMPQIVKTPRSGTAVTHRVGFIIAASNTTAAWGDHASPRSTAAPQLNRWLADQLPPPEKICVRVTLRAGAGDKINVKELEIQPIDLVSAYGPQADDPTFGELAHRIRERARTTLGPLAPDVEVTVDFESRAEFGSTQISLFELDPLLRTLFEIMQTARPLMPDDLVFPSDEANAEPAPITSRSVSNLRKIIEPTGAHAMQRYLDAIAAALSALPAAPDALPASVADQAKLDAVRDATFAATAFGVASAVPPVSSVPTAANSDANVDPALAVSREFTPANREALVAQALAVSGTLQRRLTAATISLAAVEAATSERERFTHLNRAAQHVFGRAFRVLPEFTLTNESEFSQALDHDALLADAGEFAVEEWLQGLAMVRPAIRRYQSLCALREAFRSRDDDRSVSILQLPFSPDGSDRWLGGRLAAGYEPPLDPLLLALELPRDFEPDARQVGLLLDEWTEVIPNREHDASVAMHHDRPNAEAPQALLLVVTPRQTGQWEWEDLATAVSDTIDLAKKRAVEPDHFARETNGEYSGALPATLAAMGECASGPALDFARNNVAVFPAFLGLIILSDREGLVT